MTQQRSLIVGDVGGTNVRFARASVSDAGLRIGEVWKRPGRDYPTFMDALAAFLEEQPGRDDGAAFGLAGIVTDGEVQLLHRDWTIRSKEIAEALSVERVTLANDFVAMARSAPELAPEDSREISPGVRRLGNVVVTGPGTGLGVATLKDAGPAGWVVVGGEGGHQLFSPQTEFEWALAQKLRARQGYVSNEHIASGSGFEALLTAAAEVLGVERPQASPGEIQQRAATGEEFARAICRVRAAAVMDTAGDAALQALATGGVWLAGAVGRALEPWLKEKRGLDRFYKRGPREAFMSEIPIRLITSDLAPLRGAALLWLDEDRRGWV
jgi:glucokinase